MEKKGGFFFPVFDFLPRQRRDWILTRLVNSSENRLFFDFLPPTAPDRAKF